ncbi:hypothetical protein JL39_26815 [Rhizobium sp. YS-1r]|jgi:hypothetical protein|nr:hypothetical protein JL39_26815 [Rhizobium sp. YS-1r]
MSSEVCFYPLTQGQVAGDVQGTEVSGPGGANALPRMMKYQVRGEAVVEAFCFTNIDGVPVAVGSELARNVNTGLVEIEGPDKVKLERIDRTALASPINDNWGCRIRYRSFR